MKSKLLPAVLIGAVVGAALSMLDKSTREHTVEQAKKLKDTTVYFAQNREELQQLVEQRVSQVTSLYQAAEQNIQSIVEKIEDAKTLPDTLTSLVTETKDAFSKKEDVE